MRAGERVPFVLCWMPSHAGAPQVTDATRTPAGPHPRVLVRLDRRLQLPGEYAAPVLRSLITLKALTYAPTGGIVAAPTTSLPEDLGGVRNWDYRYCWLRDATITLEALLRTGYTAEAAAWREWLERPWPAAPGTCRSCTGSAGERRLAEWEASWLPGYERSAPVRIGNAAVDQRQLDVYGEVIDAITLGKQAGLRFDGTPGRWSASCWSSWRSTGTSRTRASGRSAARGGTSCTPGSWPGWPSTGPARSPS